MAVGTSADGRSHAARTRTEPRAWGRDMMSPHTGTARRGGRASQTRRIIVPAPRAFPRRRRDLLWRGRPAAANRPSRWRERSTACAGHKTVTGGGGRLESHRQSPTTLARLWPWLRKIIFGGGSITSYRPVIDRELRCGPSALARARRCDRTSAAGASETLALSPGRGSMATLRRSATKLPLGAVGGDASERWNGGYARMSVRRVDIGGRTAGGGPRFAQ